MSVYIPNTVINTVPVLVPGPTDVPKEISASRDIWLGGPTVAVGSGLQIGAGRVYFLSPGTWYVVSNARGELDVRIPNQEDAPFAPGEEYGASLYDGCLSVSSRLNGTPLVMTSGFNWVSAFRSPKTFICNKMYIVTGTVAAGATPTLVRFGLYSFDPVAGTGPLVASTPNDTSLLNATDTYFEKAVSSPYMLRKGNWYAASILVVTAAAAPNIIASLGTTGVRRHHFRPPILSQLTSGHTDLPANLTNPGVAGNFSPIIGIIS